MSADWEIKMNRRRDDPILVFISFFIGLVIALLILLGINLFH